MEVFKSFYNHQGAIDLKEFLHSKGIEAEIVLNKPVADKVLVGDGLEKDFFVKIDPDDFDQANKLIDAHIEGNLSQLDPDYYLFSFADEELFEIVQKSDEWNNQDVILAKKILRDRGYDLSEKQVSDMRSTRIKELSQSESENPKWMYLGYFATIVVPPIGLIFGLSLLQAKKLLPDGTKVLAYNQQTRMRAQRIVIVSLFLSALWIIAVATGYIRPRNYEPIFQ
ncbi:MAG TPA: hypothetical protein VHM26_17905 [Chitinophagaceae bacterium]|nr:hypothetical protein [Chitinophagaceae bacterium]